MSSPDQVISAVDHYKRKMERHALESPVLLHALTKLDRLEGISIAVLHQTGIGKAVNSLKKHENEDVAQRARAIVAKWKEIVANEEEQQAESPSDGGGQGPPQPEPEARTGSPEPPAPTPVETPVESPCEPPEAPPKKRSKRDRHESDERSVHKSKKSAKSKTRDRERSESSSRSDRKKSSTPRDESRDRAKTGSAKSHRDSHKSSARPPVESNAFAHALAAPVPAPSNGASTSAPKKRDKSSSGRPAPASPRLNPPSDNGVRTQAPPAPAPTVSVGVPANLNPNYKPLPRQPDNPNGVTRKMNHQSEDEALSALISMRKSKSSRTMVYSGAKRTGYMGEVPSLQNLCIQVLQEHVDAIDECGGLGYDILEPVLARALPPTLMHIEECNPNLMEETGPLWERFCKKNFAKAEREEFESWREMFERCTTEREEKLNMLKVKVKDSYKREAGSQKKAKLAYVGTVAKPPRGVMRAQAKNGTGLPVGFKMGKDNVPVRSAVAPVSIGGGAKAKPKVAPMMAKSLRMARGLKGGFRR